MNEGKQLARALRAAYWAMNRLTNDLLAVHDVTADQFTLLSRLADEDGINQTELARRASSDPNTIRPMLLLLEKDGLITRKASASDARAYALKLTAAGRAGLRGMVADTERCRRQMLSSVRSGSVKDLCENLQAIAQALQAARSAAEQAKSNKRTESARRTASKNKSGAATSRPRGNMSRQE